MWMYNAVDFTEQCVEYYYDVILYYYYILVGTRCVENYKLLRYNKIINTNEKCNLPLDILHTLIVILIIIMFNGDGRLCTTENTTVSGDRCL